MITLAQLIQKSPACSVTKLRMLHLFLNLHWLKLKEHIHYKLFCLVYKTVTITQPAYLYNLICVQFAHLVSSSLFDTRLE